MRLSELLGQESRRGHLALDVDLGRRQVLLVPSVGDAICLEPEQAESLALAIIQAVEVLRRKPS